MASLIVEETNSTTFKPVGSLPNRFSTSIDNQRQILRRKTLFKSQKDLCPQNIKQNYPKMVRSKTRSYKKLTIKKKNGQEKQTSKQGRKISQDISSLEFTPQPPHNTTQYIIQAARSINDYPLNENLHSISFEDEINDHSMLGSMRGIFFYNDSKNSSLFLLNKESADESENREQNLSKVSNIKTLEAPEMEVEPVILSSYQTSNENANISSNNSNHQYKEKNFDSIQLIERARSNPVEAEEIIQNLIEQVKIREEIIQNLKVRQQC